MKRTAAIVMLLAGCGPTSSSPEGQVPGPGGVADASVIPPQPDASCGAQSEEIELINLGDPPDMLIVLDRSSSMSLTPGLFPLPTGNTKWKLMRTALTELTDEREDNINFGLSVFPTDDNCGVAPGAEVDPGPGNAAPIQSWLGSHSPAGNTPAHLALSEALAVYQSLPVNPEGRFVLFATDGIPNCGGPMLDEETGNDTVAAITALRNAGIDTFVLGFVDNTLIDTTILDEAAVAGGRPNTTGSHDFYQVDDAADLSAALQTIAGGIITPSCSYELADPPPDPDKVTVTIDGVAVPRSPSKTEGWEYHPDGSTITFFGSYCDDIESGDVTAVSFVYGCPGPISD